LRFIRSKPFTYDNSNEFAVYEEITETLGVNPYYSSEKGGIEIYGDLDVKTSAQLLKKMET